MKYVVRKGPLGGYRHVRMVAILFSLPAIGATLLFGYYPLALGLMMAFLKFRLIGDSTFIGFANLRIVLQDPMLVTSFRNTFYYAALNIGLVFLPPIIVAILLLEMRKSVIRVMMLLWFIPIAGMASLVIWKWFYQPQYGVFNGILDMLGLPQSGWLQDKNLAMFCIVLPSLIMYGPGLIYIATLQGIPEELYEAAELEGSGFWQKVWSITLPRIRPIIAMMLILAIIGAMQVFNQPKVMTGGGGRVVPLR